MLLLVSFFINKKQVDRTEIELRVQVLEGQDILINK